MKSNFIIEKININFNQKNCYEFFTLQCCHWWIHSDRFKIHSFHNKSTQHCSHWNSVKYIVFEWKQIRLRYLSVFRSIIFTYFANELLKMSSYIEGEQIYGTNFIHEYNKQSFSAEFFWILPVKTWCNIFCLKLEVKKTQKCIQKYIWNRNIIFNGHKILSVQLDSN